MSRLGERLPAVRGQEERNRLVTENRRLSYFAARRWANQFRLDTEDAASECDLALIKAADLWRPDGGRTFAGYALKAMFNHLLNVSKKQRRSCTAYNLDAGFDWQPDPRQCDPALVAMDRAEVGRLHDAIKRLDTRARQVILARVQGERPKAIAARFGVTRQRIEQIEERARLELREMLRCYASAG
jgi:RNA polymerase sigma factor (sigma-70 family)